MKRVVSTTTPLHDYDQALKSAVSWLGDRYLLAEPVRKRQEEFKGFYLVPRRWHDAARKSAPHRAVRTN